MEVAYDRRLKEPESESAKLMHLVAEQALVVDGLKEFSRKNEDSSRQHVVLAPPLTGASRSAKRAVTWA